jgi:hypothetical protein
MEGEMRLALIALTFGLAGCVTVTEQGKAQLDNFVETVRREPLPEASPLYQAVEIGPIKGGRVGNATSNSVAREKDVQTSLSTALSARKALASGAGRYRLDTKILESSYPYLAMTTVEVTTRIEYALVEVSSGKTVFRTTVEAKEATPFESSPIYAIRIAFSTAQSLTENATIALDQIVAASESRQFAASPN